MAKDDRLSKKKSTVNVIYSKQNGAYINAVYKFMPIKLDIQIHRACLKWMWPKLYADKLPMQCIRHTFPC
jgi:hypothetical protein